MPLMDTPDEVKEWLQQNKAGDVADEVLALGVECSAELLYVTEDDLKTAGMLPIKARSLLAKIADAFGNERALVKQNDPTAMAIKQMMRMMAAMQHQMQNLAMVAWDNNNMGEQQDYLQYTSEGSRPSSRPSSSTPQSYAPTMCRTKSLPTCLYREGDITRGSSP